LARSPPTYGSRWGWPWGLLRDMKHCYVDRYAYEDSLSLVAPMSGTLRNEGGGANVKREDMLSHQMGEPVRAGPVCDPLRGTGGAIVDDLGTLGGALSGPVALNASGQGVGNNRRGVDHRRWSGTEGNRPARRGDGQMPRVAAGTWGRSKELRLAQRRLKATWKGGMGGTGMFPSHVTCVSGESVVDLFDG
jgi:hypothetical protein